MSLYCDRCDKRITDGCECYAETVAMSAASAHPEIRSTKWMDALTEEVARTVTEIKESRYALSRTKAIEKLQELHLRMAHRVKKSTSIAQ